MSTDSVYKRTNNTTAKIKEANTAKVNKEAKNNLIINLLTYKFLYINLTTIYIYLKQQTTI
ncbi:MAG: hypothetical protein BWY21_01039 [Parcubacteria group bacterium ADurb.Bin216]|nr:MAG: hypothetical protein BWY21_01039 [Parcubacteria group bacterium ADurb.Bin216]